ncbi:hypothetical protein [Marivirga harenae]|uniref:hypothetical protein n=1 Tax=Marivirga harenae TaxID=2010992 RepID=UPI0026E0A17A|nr:hypothetical protein [Marivirga harenae]WKV13133.1 hypothetical protein Q3Y49_04745 [Marivirga harenae]|tara:strand:- start:278924 stop:279748 length:825 start_codon:yes stop_codon:yes gene_type:complete
MKKYIRFLYHVLRLIIKVNLIKTILLNFKTLPIRHAVKLPIFIYGKAKFKNLKGDIEIIGNINTGMIQFGKDIDGFPQSYLPITIHIGNKIIFNGPVIFSGGINLTNWTGIINFGRCTTFGSGVVIKSTTLVKIGNYTRITPNCVLMDSDVHFVTNINTGKINRNNGEIIIGEKVWVNSGTVITKGCVIPDQSIVARNSFLNRDYSIDCKSNAFIVGSPGKIKATGVYRIFSFDSEKIIKEHFSQNKDLDFYYDMGVLSSEKENKDVQEFFKLF